MVESIGQMDEIARSARSLGRVVDAAKVKEIHAGSKTFRRGSGHAAFQGNDYG